MLASLDINDTGAQVVSFQGVNFCLKMKRGAGDILIVLLHGATRQDTNPFPYFPKFLPLTCHQVSLADPGLEGRPELLTTWYLGDASKKLVTTLPAFLAGVSDHLGAKRLIFIGGSAGGFAALLYSKLCGPGAIAVASCPQMNLPNHNLPEEIDRLRKICFPQYASLDDFAANVPLALGPLYADGEINRAIILISAGDRNLLARHLSGFMSCLNKASYANILLEVGYWGVKKHSGSVPTAAWLPWVKILVTHTDWSADNLMHIRWESAAANAQPTHRTIPAKKDIVGFSPEDLKISRLLQDYQLTEH